MQQGQQRVDHDQAEDDDHADIDHRLDRFRQGKDPQDGRHRPPDQACDHQVDDDRDQGFNHTV